MEGSPLNNFIKLDIVMNNIKVFPAKTHSYHVAYVKKGVDYFIATLVIASLFWMPVYFYLSGITVTTYLEESVGYRYFYSLRLAFGHESAWLPQGQLATLYHVLIQYGLTIFIWYRYCKAERKIIS